MLSNSSNAKKIHGATCLPWFWMGYVSYDRAQQVDRKAPEVDPRCR